MPIGSHHSAAAKSDTWLTPPHILEPLGPFDLDPCTPEAMPWQTARHRFTPADDGLSQAWFGRVWLNPPYGRALADWLDRMARHGRGTALIFARTETEAFHRHVWKQASALLFLQGRLHFCDTAGVPAKANAGAPSCLIAYGIEDADRLAECGLEGAFVPLSCTGQTVFIARHCEAGISWRDLLAAITDRQGGTVTLEIAYRLVQNHPKAQANPNWRAKVRQTFNRGGFTRIERGTYRQGDLFA